MGYDRKEFLKNLGFLSTGAFLVPGMIISCAGQSSENKLFFDISLAEWSLHQSLFSGKLSHLQFPETAKKIYNIGAVEYVNQFFMDKAEDRNYLNELNMRCSDLGIDQLLIMIDAEGDLASTDEAVRKQAVQNHYKWVEAANFLGCHSIRVNLYGNGTKEELKKTSVDSLRRLAEFARDYEINILVENHGGNSSNAAWVAAIIQQVDMENCGTLPDFGNFCLKRESGGRWEGKCIEKYDRYKGMRQMMPFAKGVSAKSYNFNNQGYETTINYEKMLTIIRKSGYNGHIGIEYEGTEMSPEAGIKATKKLLLTLGQKMKEEYVSN